METLLRSLHRRFLSGSFFVLLTAALLGGIAGAFIYSALENNDGPRRGTIVRLGTNFSQIDTTPFCVQSQHFCIVKLESGDLIALYTYDTHPEMRTRGCDVAWKPDFSFNDPGTGENAQGWFLGRCSGSIYRMNGELVFGPRPRNLDRFELTLKQGEQDYTFIEVDTRKLICGENQYYEDATCELAPPPQ